MFIDDRSAFNNIIPPNLMSKVRVLGFGSCLCNLTLNFLTRRQQKIKTGNNTSSTIILNSGAPQGCVLSPLLYSLYVDDCVAKFHHLPWQDSNPGPQNIS